jgi:uncharacterized protein with von Willebrand factor type A (vWA) domain
MDRTFDPGRLDRPYAALDRLPRSLWLQAIINGRGMPAARFADVERLRLALVDERLPLLPAGWPLDPALVSFRQALESLQVGRLVGGDEAIADEVVRVLLWHIDRIADYMETEDEESAVAMAVAAFVEDWRDVHADIEAVRAVFEVLGDSLKKENWALIRGLLRTEGWAEMLRIRRMLAGVPGLGELIRHLGRSIETEESDPDRPPPSAMEDSERSEPVLREVRFPGMVAETRGVRRGGALGRLLPSELVLLRLPRMRLCWYARLAEQALLGYEDEDFCLERRTASAANQRLVVKPVRQPKCEAGPMVLCVDTSASMRGGAELVAKGVLLEAMRTAAVQGRRCYVFAFGGPGEVVERELSLDANGVATILGFMAQSFQGGTDIGEPLERALARIGQGQWRAADLLLATDGEFGATPALAGWLREEKVRLGLRVQGVLIGDRETVGLRELCDNIFWVREWRRFGGGSVGSPVHDKSLTAIYFPGALR